MYRHLSIDVGSDDPAQSSSSPSRPWTAEDGLNMFFRPEKREIKCEKCDGGRTATQTMTVIRR